MLLATLVAGGLLALLSSRALTVGERGEMVYVQVVCGLVPLMCSLGIPTEARRLVAQRTCHPRHFTAICISVAAAAGVACLTVVALYAGSSRIPLGLASGCLGAMNTLLLFMRELIYGLGRPVAGASIDAGYYVMQLLCCFTVFLLGGRMVEIAVLCCAAAGLPVLVMSGTVIRKTRIASPGNRPSLRVLVTASLPFAVQTVGQAGIQRADRLIVGILLGSEVLGRYAANSTLGEAMWIAGAASLQLRFASAAQGGYPAGLFHRDHRLLGSALMIALIPIVALSGPVITIVFGDGYAISFVERALMITAAGGYTLFIFSSGVAAALGLRRALVSLSLCGIGLVVVLTAALTHFLGLLGAAAASLLSYSLLLIAAYALTLRRLNQQAGRWGTVQ
jgi:O-antigen/teichoic acid export membrane protein